MMTRLDLPIFAAIAALGVLGSAGPAEATVITFDVAPVAGSTFEYTYVVENNSLPAHIEEFAIYFDVDFFENLRMAGTPAGWDPEVIQPDTVLRDDGFFDVLALAGGIPLGGSLGGFTIQADFLGAGTPGRQRFEILDPVTFAVLDSGFTVPAGVRIPEPVTLWLMGLGLVAISYRRRGTSP